MTRTPSIILFGSNGQLGQAIERVAEERGIACVSFDRQSADVTEAGMVAGALARVTGGLVVNAAAYTAVDRAESEEQLAFKVNCDGARNIAEACSRLGGCGPRWDHRRRRYAPAEAREDDLRTMPVKYESDSSRFRDFKDGSRLLTETTHDDWPIA